MGYGPHSDHYGDGVQPLDLIDSMGLGFYEGQVVKYVSRWESKDGLKDLEKAAFYLNRLIGLVKDEEEHPPTIVTTHPGGIVRQPLPGEEILLTWHGKKAGDGLVWTKQAAEDAQRGRKGSDPTLPPEQQACR